MSPMMDPLFNGAPPGTGPFIPQQHGHKDMVQCCAFNRYGNRFAIGAVDGRVKVYDRARDGTWVLCDTWTAHNAEVLEVRFLYSCCSLTLLCQIALSSPPSSCNT
jgi:nucleoporin SEH1